jgi:hypothetical protein
MKFRDAAIAKKGRLTIHQGTVGNWHIGIYTRFLLMYLVDPLARPKEPLVRMWINMVRFVKSKAPA